VLSAPLNVHWELTNRCNLACRHCYQQDDAADAALPGATGLWTIAERLVEAGVFELTMTGGEILLVPEVFDLIDYFNAAGIEPHVTSNGTLVDDRRADELARRRLTFQVSIDSSDPLVHDGVRRRPGALRRAVEGVERLVERGVPVAVSYTCMPQNVEDAAGVAALAEQIGVTRVCIGEVLPSYGDSQARSAMEHRRLDYVYRHLDQVREQFEGRVEVSLAMHRAGDAPTDVCTALDRDLAILHDGHAYPCPFVRHPDYDMGSVLEHPIAALWNSDVARRFRDEKRVASVPHCRILAAASPSTAIDPGTRTAAQARAVRCDGCASHPTTRSTRP
jgi:MoaA/NifB/PqqE/SkfB family radical SAM enzyme